MFRHSMPATTDQWVVQTAITLLELCCLNSVYMEYSDLSCICLVNDTCTTLS